MPYVYTCLDCGTTTEPVDERDDAKAARTKHRAENHDGYAPKSDAITEVEASGDGCSLFFFLISAAAAAAAILGHGAPIA
ncbi:hypothetical protein [Streptomyces sp. NPDC059411]|uniref:hypothetical protein n=1 Tax=Streptomyces sp. NPDC059411 TaxID=3346825 RepID=UPI0036AAA267